MSICRHSITWWRSRCVALEHENKLLRDKVRLLAHGSHDTRKDDYYYAEDIPDKNYAEHDTDNEDLEFNLTEDVLNFFETSERHKRKMRQKNRSNKTVDEDNSEGIPFVSAAEKDRMRNEEAKLLYGDLSSQILAIETALQNKIERFEDTTNPQYWPNIPLKP